MSGVFIGEKNIKDFSFVGMMKAIYLFLLLVSAVASAQNFSPCEIKEVPPPVSCGTMEVYENRAENSGRKIALNIVLLRALEADKLPDPIFVLQGGPGQAATKLADFYGDIFSELRKKRDIVLLDQRGTGKSNSLQCTLKSKTELLPHDEIEICKAELLKKADPRQYSTTVAMQDLDEVRRRFGYKQINIYGTSYGTWAAFSYLRQFPDSVRTLVLKGVVPPTMELSVTTAFDSERSMNALIQDCTADKDCANAFPALRKDYESVLTTLRKGPVPVKISNPEIHEFSRAAFMLTLRALLHAPGSSTQIPLMIHRAAAGDYNPLSEIYAKMLEGYRQEISVGMFLAVYCTEEIPRIDPKNLPTDLDSTFHGDTWIAPLFRNCSSWPKGEVSSDFYKPLQSTKPVLLISGGLDPVTPGRWAAEAAKTLPNSLNVVAPKAGHSFNLMKGCVDKIITKFVQNGSGEGIDISCVNQIQRPPFVLK